MHQSTKNPVLTSGKPNLELKVAVAMTDPDELRPYDLQEMLDWTDSIGMNRRLVFDEFGSQLVASLGLMDKRCLAYTIWHGDSEIPVFVATLTQIGDPIDGVCLLRGYAIQRVYKLLSRRKIHDAIERLFEEILTDMLGKFGASVASCHVKNNNVPTLTMWKWLGRRMRHRGVKINITDNPLGPGYKLVTMEVK